MNNLSDTQVKIKELLSQIEANQDNLNWLANCAIQLSVLLYNLGEELGAARLLEEQTIIGYLDITPLEGERRMSVAEAEKRGIVDCQGTYDKLKINYQSIQEIIQSLKKKIDLTSQQIKVGI